MGTAKEGAERAGPPREARVSSIAADHTGEPAPDWRETGASAAVYAKRGMIRATLRSDSNTREHARITYLAPRRSPSGI